MYICDLHLKLVTLQFHIARQIDEANSEFHIFKMKKPNRTSKDRVTRSKKTFEFEKNNTIQDPKK